MSVFCDKDADLTPEFTTECYIRRKFIAEGKISQGEEKANIIFPAVAGKFPGGGLIRMWPTRSAQAISS